MNFYKVNLVGNFLFAGKYKRSIKSIIVCSQDEETAKIECENSIDVIVERFKQLRDGNGRLLLRKSETNIPRIAFIECINGNTTTALFEGEFQIINLVELRAKSPELFI